MTAEMTITVNGRSHAWPTTPLVVVCVDRSEPDYMDDAVDAGAMPWLAEARARGTDLIADCVVPSFTTRTTCRSSPERRPWFTASPATTSTTTRLAPR